jgi:hypothetical protein
MKIVLRKGQPYIVKPIKDGSREVERYMQMHELLCSRGMPYVLPRLNTDLTVFGKCLATRKCHVELFDFVKSFTDPSVEGYFKVTPEHRIRIKQSLLLHLALVAKALFKICPDRHGDLKPENIVATLDRDHLVTSLHIIDWDKVSVGTHGYRPPEQYVHQRSSCDVFSFAITMYVVLHDCTHPFGNGVPTGLKGGLGSSHERMKELVHIKTQATAAKYGLCNPAWAPLYELWDRCLHPSRSLRPSMREVAEQLLEMTGRRALVERRLVFD